MILYNMRNRGPYEYDKFTLNILQISNAVSLGELNELKENAQSKESLVAIENKINSLYDSLVGNNDTQGLCETIYLKSYRLK